MPESRFPSDDLSVIVEHIRRLDLAPSLALMQLVIAATTPEEIDARFERDPTLAELQRLWRDDPGLWARIKGVLQIGQAPSEDHSGDVIQHWAAAFDRAVALSPEASVAAYTLGHANTLRAATTEVTQLLQSWGLLHHTATVLELGCGIGRFAEAFAPLVAQYRGLDISSGMVAEARRRCATFSNVQIDQSDGREVTEHPDESTSLILAADVFPYIVDASLLLARVHFHHFARMLRPTGTLILVNFSYRGDDRQDISDVMHLAREVGLTVSVSGERPFRLWDGLLFRLSRSR